MSRGGGLTAWVPKLAKGRVLVIGDLILDEFVWGKVDRISPEAPVPVVWTQRESAMPGGAANVANNIAALGGHATLLGVIGEDRAGKLLCKALTERGIEIGSLVIDERRPTTLKTRVIAHHQQVVRIDRETVEPLEAKTLQRLIASVREAVEGVDAVIIEDYGKGVISARLLSTVLPLARGAKLVVTVDPKEEHFRMYRGVTTLTPNRFEAAKATGIKTDTDDGVKRAGKAIVKELGCRSVLVTLGEDGMRLFESSGRTTHIPTKAQEVFDVAGAGDTVIAAYSLALAAGASALDAARLANYAAGIVVGKVGTAVATPEELKARISVDARGGRR
ncbi:MAG: D-glycero-beta-D-manno-heptose-7-phosphate kinase [Candidatus Omnitrophica bacterium]|nr:D-glycero-beta-D-manno-heptose-7-phosphate kinase [Candidatus Omnitrophota bacterium]